MVLRILCNTASSTFLKKSFLLASDEVVDTLARLGNLLDDMVQAYGHSEGFLKLLALLEPPSES